MDLSDFLSPERVVFLHGWTKEEALEELVNAVCEGKPSLRPHEVLKSIWKREKTISSWIVSGFAIPHARLPGLGGFILAEPQLALPEINKQRLTLMIVNHALAVAHEVQAKAVLVHADALESPTAFSAVVTEL